MDDDDVIIRRRLAQKVEFMMADDVVDALPDKAALQAFFNDNRAAYDAPESLSWRHVFTDSKAEAISLMDKLNRNDENWRQEGRPFMLNRDYAQQTEIELSRLMGTEFAAALFDLPPGRWAGPVASAYGWHVVKLDARQEAKPADFDRMVDRVARDWQQAQRQDAMAAAWQDLRRQYEIELLPVDEADSRP
jgi:peptidyl-prolyl cis-trans isomerase C